MKPIVDATDAAGKVFEEMLLMIFVGLCAAPIVALLVVAYLANCGCQAAGWEHGIVKTTVALIVVDRAANSAVGGDPEGRLSSRILDGIEQISKAFHV